MNPAETAGFMREGERVERARVPWVLGGRRGVGDDALWGSTSFSEDRIRAAALLPRRGRIGHDRSGE
jgi:hypothetical protein